MSISKIRICNLALSHIGAEPISSFEDNCKEAQQCNLLFKPVLHWLLSMHKWGFALRTATLNRVQDNSAISEYSYFYGLPSDLLYPLELVNVDTSTQSDKPIYSIVNRQLHTNLSNVRLRYISTVDDVSILPAYFSELFSLFLASRLATIITGSFSTASQLLAMAEIELNEAITQDMRQHGQKHMDINNNLSNAIGGK